MKKAFFIVSGVFFVGLVGYLIGGPDGPLVAWAIAAVAVLTTWQRRRLLLLLRSVDRLLPKRLAVACLMALAGYLIGGPNGLAVAIPAAILLILWLHFRRKTVDEEPPALQDLGLRGQG